jgi:anti-sigma-K factor RskA
MTAADPHLDTAAYALHAVPADEAQLVESHLETCESCSAELVGFLETAALLGSAIAERPPASLRQTIMARVAVTPQLPPLVAPPAAPPAAEPEESRSSRELRRGAHRSDTGLQRWYRRPGALLAAAVAAVVVGGGAIVAVNQVGEDDTVAQTPEQCIAQAADQRQITPAQGGGTVRFAPSCGAALLDVTGLPALPGDRTYQLWALAGTQPRSLGLLPDATAGKQQIVAAQTQSGENAVAITAEPAGGSEKPTLPILWQAALTS